MKKTMMFAAAALALGVASFTAPASAATAVPAGVAAQSGSTDVSAQRYVQRRTVIRRGGPRCETRIVRTRGPMGRVVVRKTRVCR